MNNNAGVYQKFAQYFGDHRAPGSYPRDSVFTYSLGTPDAQRATIFEKAKVAYQPLTSQKTDYIAPVNLTKDMLERKKKMANAVSSPDGGTTKIVPDGDLRLDTKTDASVHAAGLSFFNQPQRRVIYQVGDSAPPQQTNSGNQSQKIIADVAAKASELTQKATEERYNKLLWGIGIGAGLVLLFKR